MLTSLSASSYKAFPGRVELELAPLTILLGRNNSGKSALVRLSMLLHHAMQDDAASPLPLAVNGLSFGDSFVDLVHGRRSHGLVGVGFGVTTPDGPRKLWVEVQHIDELKLQVVSSWTLTDGEGQVLQSYRWTGESERAGERAYRTSDGTTQHLDFDSLLLDDELATTLRRAFGSVLHLGPFRDAPESFYRFPGGTPRSVGHGGKHAAALLGADHLRNQGRVLSRVADFYHQSLGGWRLEVESEGQGFSLVLRSPADPHLVVNLNQGGTGLGQVLPLVVQRMLEPESAEPRLEVVEQPELHLHPGAHGAVADLFVQAAQHSQTRFLVETHSENFVLRVRRRIAEGMDPALVRLYWVHSGEVEPIAIHADGAVEPWPRGVFAEDYEEVKAMERARRARP